MLCLFSTRSPQPWATTELSAVATVLLSPEHQIFEMRRYTAFAEWLLSFRNRCLRSLNAFSWLDSMRDSVTWMPHSVFTHSPTEYVGGLHSVFSILLFSIYIFLLYSEWKSKVDSLN